MLNQHCPTVLLSTQCGAVCRRRVRAQLSVAGCCLRLWAPFSRRWAVVTTVDGMETRHFAAPAGPPTALSHGKSRCLTLTLDDCMT